MTRIPTSLVVQDTEPINSQRFPTGNASPGHLTTFAPAERGSVSPAAGTGGRGAARRTTIASSTHRLTAEQVRAASELFGQSAHKSVDALAAKDLLVDMNLLPPSGFSVPEALESVSCPLDRVSLEAFLFLVNGVWVAMEDCVSHEMTVKHAYEAFQKMQAQQQASAPDSLWGEPMHTSPRSTRMTFVGDGSLLSAAAGSDPLKVIVSSNAHRGFRNLQQFLSPSQGEPEMLRSFVHLGAQDQGAGFFLDTGRMAQRCLGVGMSSSEAAIVTRIFDTSCSGEIDYDDFLSVMRTDLERLGLKPKLLSQLRKLLFANSAGSNGSGGGAPGFHTTSVTAQSMLLPSPVLSVGGADAALPPMQIGTTARMRQSTVTGAAGPPPHPRKRSSPQPSTVSQAFPDSDQDDMADGGELFGEAVGSYSAAGRSLFQSISLRQPSIHEFLGVDTAVVGLNTPPSIFYTKLHEDLVQCRTELEGLKEYERAAARLQAKATGPNGTRQKRRTGSQGSTSDMSTHRDGSVGAPTSGGTAMSSLKEDDSADVATIATTPSGQSLPPIRPHPHGGNPSPRGYGIGRNPAIPAYRYGVPPPPRLVHYSHRTPAPPQPHPAPVVPHERRLMMQHDRCATFFTSSLSSPRPMITSCGYAPSPRMPHRKTAASPTGGNVDARAGTTKTPEPLSDLVSPSSAPHRLGQTSDSVPALPLLSGLAQDRELRISLNKLADFNNCVEKIVSPAPIMDGMGNGASPTRSPRNFPETPSNRGNRGGVGGACVSPTRAASSARPSAASTIHGSRTAGRGKGSPPCAVSARLVSPTNRRSRTRTSDEDTITDPSQAPAAVGYMLARDATLAQQMFDHQLRSGQFPLGCVVDASLRRNGQAAQALYGQPAPRVAA